MAVHYWGRRYDQGGPPTELALKLLKKALQDSNRGIRMKAATSLLLGNLKVEPDVYVKEIVPSVLTLLYDSSIRVRHSVLFWLNWWIHSTKFVKRWFKKKTPKRCKGFRD